MPVTVINATAGSATANSYVTLTVAEQYHLDRPAVGTTWADATNDQKNAALLWSTKLLERLFEWNGSVVDTTQALLWPRAGLIDTNGWETLDTTTVPLLIQYATAEFARQLLVEDRTADSDIIRQGIKSIRASAVRLEFFGTAFDPSVPDVVANLIPAEWGFPRNSGGLQERELVRS